MPICNLSELPQRLQKGQTVLGIDPGSTVIGIAISDPNLKVASPLVSLARRKLENDLAAIAKIIRERNVGGLVVGLPKNMDGSQGPAAQSARAFIKNLTEQGDLPDADLPVVFWDERLSSAAVERFMIADDMSRQRREKVVDKAAAAYILQGALDGLTNS